MNAKAAMLTIFGAVVSLLGVLWLSQGLGIIQIDPILCIKDCEPVTGTSVEWTIIGIIASIVGILITWVGWSYVGRMERMS
ncbi:hypothetical protein ACFQJ8_21400 [Halocatena marina]